MEPPGPAPPRPPSEQRRPDPPGETLQGLSLSNMGRLETQKKNKKKTYGKIEVVCLLALKNLLGL